MPGTKRKGKGNAWYLEVTIGTDFTGKPVRYNRTFHGTEKQAEKELARFYVECENGKVHKENTMKVADLCELYIEEYVTRFLKVSARRGIDPAIKIWIKPLLGQKKVAKLQRIDIQKWVNYISDPHDEKQLSPKTVKNYYSALRGMLAFAVDMGIIDASPCRNIRLPKLKNKEANYYTIEEVSSLLDALNNLEPKDLKYKVAIYIALFGGLRKSEILGLNWEDVNFNESTIKIKRTRMIKPGEGVYEDTPKTDRSNRLISLPAEIMSMLKMLKAQQLELKLILQNKYEDSPAIFKGNNGTPLYPQVLQRWFTKFLEDNGLRHIGLHSLRHTHASMLVYLGTDKMQVSSRLGHSQLSTTLNIYTHLFENADKRIASELSDQFLKSK